MPFYHMFTDTTHIKNFLLKCVLISNYFCTLHIPPSNTTLRVPLKDNTKHACPITDSVTTEY
jgi:hypothetical protein